MGKHDRFKKYWESVGKPELESKYLGLPDSVFCICENPRWLIGRDYRISGDRHWELRRKWVDSDFTLPIEYLDEDRWYQCDFTMSWDQPVEYREAVASVAEKDPGAHYRYEYKGIKLDPARIAKIYGITNSMQFTALKKILAAGNRGHKDLQQDLKDIKCACDRWWELEEEDAQ